MPQSPVNSKISAERSVAKLTTADIVRLTERLQAETYERVADFTITAWRTSEPAPFAERRSGRELKLEPGDCWGERLFDCAWFRFTACIPLETTRPLVARIDINGELCIVDESGVPVRGLTCVKSTFDPNLGAPGKTIYSIPERLIDNGRIELWADAGFNDLFGTLVGDGRIEFAEVCVCREDVRALYYDLQVLADLLDGTGENDSIRERVITVVTEAAGFLGTLEPRFVALAREALAPLFAEAKERPALHVSAIGHSHLDLAWLWPIRETIRKGARTFATALYNIERYPEYIYSCSQPQLFVWMKEHYPALYARIKEAVRAGRIEPLGTFWVEPDGNIPSGESFVRQVLHGAQVFRSEFGIVPRVCWLPDTFGYNGQFPQILKKSGHDYFVTQKLSWNIVNRFPYQSFRWIGIDGSMIPVHMLPEETYNSPAAPRSMREISSKYAQKDVSSHALMVFGIGDGGGGPDAEHLERLRRCKHLAALPAVAMTTAAHFLTAWAQDVDKFPSWSGELYLERHQGTFTTQTRAKRNNRLCEIGLREAEWAATLAELLSGIPYPADELASIWKEVLLYQFHDILPGSSIKRVYTESNARYDLILQQIENIIDRHYAAVAASAESADTHLVFNSLPWRRKRWLKHNDEWIFVDVPAMGYSELPQPGGTPRVSASEQCIENELLRVEFSGDGAIHSIYDKKECREVVAPCERGNQFVVFADNGDAWDFPIDYKTKDVKVYLREAPQALKLEKSRTYVDGPRAVMEQTYRFGHSELFLRVFLADCSELVEFEAVVEWRDPGRMLRVRFPVAVESREARFEIPFGSITRSTREDLSVETAQLEVPAQQWVDLSQEDYGVALLNDCKYGFRVKGHTLDMNVLRSVPHPGKALIDKDDTSGTGGVYTDLGRHEFRYALMPHAGRIGEAALTEAARGFNTPLRVVNCGRGLTSHFRQDSFLSGDNPAIEIAAVKRAENGGGWIVRLVNVTPFSQNVRLRSSLPWGNATETNLKEDESTREGIVGGNGDLSLEMLPFEIKTMRFCTLVR